MSQAFTAFLLYKVVMQQNKRDERLDNERQTLLNRIQSPETVIAQQAEEGRVEALPFDDDDAYWKARAAQKLGEVTAE